MSSATVVVVAYFLWGDGAACDIGRRWMAPRRYVHTKRALV